MQNSIKLLQEKLSTIYYFIDIFLLRVTLLVFILFCPFTFEQPFKFPRNFTFTSSRKCLVYLTVVTRMKKGSLQKVSTQVVRWFFHVYGKSKENLKKSWFLKAFQPWNRYLPTPALHSNTNVTTLKYLQQSSSPSDARISSTY